ncbi:MAG: hypothetical protein ABF646_02130 [Acetobacter papayae]
MARIRSVHPGLYTDEAFMTLSMTARVLIVGLWAHADDGGGFEWKPLVLKARIFPADNIDLGPVLTELEENDVIKKYDVSGKIYGAVRNFGKWQRPQKPKRFVPMPKPVREYCQSETICPDKENGSGNIQVRDEYNTGTQPVSDQSSNSSAEGRKVGREEGRKVIPSLRSGPPEPVAVPDQPVDARTRLFAEGKATLSHMTGKSAGQCGALLGRWLKTCGDQCDLLLSVIHDAADQRPAEAVPWIERAIQSRISASPASLTRTERVAAAWANVPDFPGV